MSSSSPPASLHCIYAQHDLVDVRVADEGQGVNKPVVRKKKILHALERAADIAKEGKCSTQITFQPLTEPASSLKPAERIHAPQLVDLFATGFDRWAALGDGGRDLYFSSAGRVSPPDWSELVPSQCAPRDSCQRPGKSVHGEVNYYAQDRMTPITAQTSRILHHDLAVTLAAVDAVTEGKHTQVYACTTQPGHHSGRESYGGYCFVNQAALAAQLLHEKLGRVAVLDVDYHAGNGTLAIFDRSADVFCASIHASPDIEYPYCYGWADQVGSGPGEGATMNIPLGKDTTWEEYRPALQRTLDAIKSFGARALVVSLGVDTLAHDPEAAPLAGFKLFAADYDELGRMVREAGVPTIWVQEGGYKLDEAGEIVRHVLVGRTGDDKETAQQ